MAKISFRYGAMGSCKTANALMIQYNFKEKNKKALLLKPKCENRDGDTIIKSRIGLEAECIYVEDYLANKVYNIDCIIIDEAQFLTTEQVDQFVEIADKYDIPIIAFALKVDFQSHLFEGTKRFIEVADELQEITTICWCGKKARFNARVIDGKVVKEGEQFQLGGNESYVALCRKHYYLNQLGE